MERKMILYIGASIDGRIADEHGGVEWLKLGNDGGTDMGYAEFVEGIDTIAMGRVTYDQIVNELSVGTWPYEGKNSVVFTSSYPESHAEIEFTSEDIVSWAQKEKQKEGKDIWIMGGAQLANEFLRHNLIDEIWITIIPVILGKGCLLFQPQPLATLFHLDRAETHNDCIELRYVRKSCF